MLINKLNFDQLNNRLDGFIPVSSIGFDSLQLEPLQFNDPENEEIWWYATKWSDWNEEDIKNLANCNSYTCDTLNIIIFGITGYATDNKGERYFSLIEPLQG